LRGALVVIGCGAEAVSWPLNQVSAEIGPELSLVTGSPVGVEVRVFSVAATESGRR